MNVVELKRPDRWIACSVALPKNGIEVLVWRAPHYRTSVIRCGFVTLSKCRHTIDGPVWDCDQGSWILPSRLLCHVTHWMPKPEGPMLNGSGANKGGAMGAALDLDDVAATSSRARRQLADLRAENEQMRAALQYVLEDEPDLYRVGKKAAGRLLDGRTWDEVPK